MGKQMNYFMDYDSFLLLAQKAVDLGCTIIKQDLDLGKVIESDDIRIMAPYTERFGAKEYYFHLPEAGAVGIQMINGKEHLDRGYTATGNAVIEAGYSFVPESPTGNDGTRQKKEIRHARIYCISGYYDENGEYIPRPQCLTKVYNALARYVKKLAPYTEFTDTLISRKVENYGEPYEYTHKEYITKSCLDLVQREGYEMY